MQIDLNLRARAASGLLDAVTALTAEDSGTDEADARALLALEVTGVDTTASPELAATMAAAVDLLWFMAELLAQHNGMSREAVVSSLRQEVLPRAYFDADVYRDTASD